MDPALPHVTKQIYAYATEKSMFFTIHFVNHYTLKKKKIVVSLCAYGIMLG